MGKSVRQTVYRILLAEDEIRGLDAGEKQEPTPPPESPEPEKQKTAEEKAISKLAGQTIKQASIDFDQDFGRLSLQLAGTNAPATVQWSKGGRVVFSFKGQNYILRK